MLKPSKAKVRKKAKSHKTRQAAQAVASASGAVLPPLTRAPLPQFDPEAEVLYAPRCKRHGALCSLDEILPVSWGSVTIAKKLNISPEQVEAALENRINWQLGWIRDLLIDLECHYEVALSKFIKEDLDGLHTAEASMTPLLDLQANVYRWQEALEVTALLRAHVTNITIQITTAQGPVVMRPTR